MALKIDEVLADGIGYVVGEDIRTYALYKHRKCFGAQLRSNMRFSASQGWLVAFKRRWGFVSKRPRIKKAASNPMAQIWKKLFLQEVHRCSHAVPANMVLCVDETFWRVVMGAVLTWCRVGETNRRSSLADVKTGLTVGYTISMAGDVLKPFLVKKGRTKKCLASFRLKSWESKAVKMYSPSGWVNTRIWLDVLDIVIAYKDPADTCALIYDTWGSHMDDEVVRKMIDNNIQGIPIPPGLTAELSPLDVKVNGVVKSMGRKKWRQRIWEHGDNLKGVAGVHQSGIDAVEAIYQVGRNTIRSSFTDAFGHVLPPVNYVVPDDAELEVRGPYLTKQMLQDAKKLARARRAKRTPGNADPSHEQDSDDDLDRDLEPDDEESDVEPEASIVAHRVICFVF